MPQWTLTIRLGDLVQQWKNGDINIAELADLVTTRLKESGWRAFTPYPHTWDEKVAQVQSAETPGEYEAAFEDLYDIADLDRVWIETW